MKERLHLYALIDVEGRWRYIGATANPKSRAKQWACRRYPELSFRTLMIASKEYVLEAEWKLIKLC